MTKSKNRRIGQGMKNRAEALKDVKPAASVSTDAGQLEAQKDALEPQKEVPKMVENDIPDGGTLETATVQNLDSGTPAADVAVSDERKNLEDLLRDSVDARTEEEPKPTTISDLEDLMVKTGNQVRIEPDGTVKAFPVGERPDGTFGLVVTVREGMIESIRQQAEADKQAPEEWASERFGEWLEQWWAPPQGK